MAGGQLRLGRALTDPCIQDEGKMNKWPDSNNNVGSW